MKFLVNKAESKGNLKIESYSMSKSETQLNFLLNGQKTAVGFFFLSSISNVYYSVSEIAF